MSDHETSERPGREGSAVGYSTVTFLDKDEPAQEMIGFTYFETEENCISWVWEDEVVTSVIVIPYHRIKDVESRFEATGD